MRSVKLITETERLRARLTAAERLHENGVDLPEVYPTETRFTPIGTDGDVVIGAGVCV